MPAANKSRGVRFGDESNNGKSTEEQQFVGRNFTKTCLYAEPFFSFQTVLLIFITNYIIYFYFFFTTSIYCHCELYCLFVLTLVGYSFHFSQIFSLAIHKFPLNLVHLLLHFSTPNIFFSYSTFTYFKDLYNKGIFLISMDSIKIYYTKS